MLKGLLKLRAVSSRRPIQLNKFFNMSPKGIKRKTSDTGSPSDPSLKKQATQHSTFSKTTNFDHSRPAEQFGIIQREFYPPEMSNERCEQYNNDELPRPIEVLRSTIEDTAEQRNEIGVGSAVVHWFKRDLRTQDNRSLHLASEKAKSQNVPLICVFLVSPQDYQAHLTSAVRVDYELRTLAVLKSDLAELDIPLYVETVERRKQLPTRLIALCDEWDARHVFCNIEYEVDELRREALLVRECLDNNISFTAVHDDAIVPPGSLSSGSGKQYSVFSPFCRSWCAHIHDNPDLLDSFEKPSRNPSSTTNQFPKLFKIDIPAAPPNKQLSDEEKKRFSSLWPAGETEAHERLQKFVSERIKSYNDTRNFPSANGTAVISVHLSTGTLSARAAVRAARDANNTKKLNAGNSGISGWISEIAWRDFYKHVLAHWPYVCMNKSFKYEYSDIEWNYDMENFDKWCNGVTGFPFIDAAMRQLNHTGYMHNRCRMAVASFLAKDLLLDWRLGEKYFMEHLIDGDFASNNGGWGFSASTGVDPQPYFRIFNPFLQSEKFDSKGEYIRKWVGELKEVQGNAIHDPYNRGAAKQAEKAKYPKPIVDHKKAREQALDRYKRGLGRDTA